MNKTNEKAHVYFGITINLRSTFSTTDLLLTATLGDVLFTPFFGASDNSSDCLGHIGWFVDSSAAGSSPSGNPLSVLALFIEIRIAHGLRVACCGSQQTKLLWACFLY